MPESGESIYSPELEAELDRQYRQRDEHARSELAKLYDEALERGVSPQQLILDDADSFVAAEDIFGEKRVAQFKQDLLALMYTDRDDFVEKMYSLVEPFNHDRFFDADTRARADAREAARRVEETYVGFFKLTRLPSEWECTTSDGIHVALGDPVVEIGWPREGDQPSGIKDILHTFRQIAAYIRERPEIKAVVAVSWMMSHPVTDRLGFEKFSDVPISQEQITSVLNMASDARGDTYRRSVEAGDVQFGAISREAFLARYHD